MINIDLTGSSFILGYASDKSKNFISDNLQLSPLPSNQYDDEEEIIEALKNNTISELNELLKDDTGSYQGWTYVADYKTHQFSHQKGATYYIHARINKDNKLEFGIFEEIISSKNGKIEKILSRNSSFNNSDIFLKIASKEEAEKFILTADKQRIKLSALPKYAGFLNEYSERLLNDHVLSVFGNIWTYWYTISNNTLYFCGFPLLLDTEEKGLIYNINGEIIEADLPPTSLNYENANEDSQFKIAIDLVYPDSPTNGAKYILEKYCDSLEPTSVSKTVIGKLESGSATNYVFNDIISIADSYSELGGAYMENGKMQIAGPDDLILSQTEDEYPIGNSGFYPFESSYIDIISDSQCKYYQKALKVNGFYITNINNNIQINIGDPLVYLGAGRLIDNNTGGGGGFNSWFGGGGSGGGSGKGEEGEESKRGKKTYIIDCGDIGYEYYPDEIHHPQIFSHAVYEVDGIEYEGKDVHGLFSYTVDADRLRLAITGNTRVYSDAQHNILTKKLSRKFEAWISLFEDQYMPVQSTIWTEYSFNNFIKKPNIEDCRYITPENMNPQAGGGGAGQAFMNLNVVDDEDILLKSIATSFNNETEMPNWGAGEISKSHCKFKNNKLTIWDDVSSSTNFRGLNSNVVKTFEIVDSYKIKNEIKNSDIKIENTIFKKKQLYPSSPAVSVNSFYAKSKNIDNHNGEKIRIRYKISRVKLTPNLRLIQELLNICASGYKINNNLQYNPGIKCGDEDLYNSELITENQYVHTKNRADGNSNWGNETILDDKPISEVAPLILNFKDLTMEYVPKPKPNIQVQTVDDTLEVCEIVSTSKADLKWDGLPQMKMKYKITHNTANLESIDNSTTVNVKIIPLGSGWYEASQQRDENGELTENYMDNDLQAHRFTSVIPQKYLNEGENNNIAKITFFGMGENGGLISIDDEIYSNIDN